MSNPKYLKIPPKKQITFRVEQNLYYKFVNYAEARGLNQTETGREILTLFFENKTVTNTYLNDVGGLYFKIPMDIEYKEKCISNQTILNRDNDNNTIGENTISIKINSIPNNLDLISSKGYLANKEGVLHAGIDFVFIPSVIKKPKSIYYSSLDIDLLDGLYVFYFEVTADNTTNVVLINPVEAINKLSKVNNRIVKDSLVDIMEALEEIQQQANYNYKVGMDNLKVTGENVSNEKLFDWLDTSYITLLIELEEFSKSNVNDNIKLPIVNENTPLRLIEPSKEKQ